MKAFLCVMLLALVAAALALPALPEAAQQPEAAALPAEEPRDKRALLLGYGYARALPFAGYRAYYPYGYYPAAYGWW